MLVIPKFPELSVLKIWSLVKESEELMQFFPNYQNKQLPDRNFLLTILSTKYPDELRKLVYEAKLNRKKNDEELDELIEIDPVIKQSIMNVLTIRSKFLIIRMNLATKGRSNFLMKKGAMLSRKRAAPKKYMADMSFINAERDRRSRDEETKEEYKEMNVDRG